MTRIDLNADLGESVGARIVGDDAGVMPWISSANIACGFHAGDPAVMRATLIACDARGVAAGAHPSFHDLEGFGRREMQVDAEELHAQVLYQIGALAGIARALGVPLRHVKPHGALYNQAARDPLLADAIAAAVQAFDPTLVLVGLAGSALIDAGLAHGLAVRHEAFCDRRYRADGSLVPRTRSGAVLDDPQEAAAQAVSIATRGFAVADDGSRVPIMADSLCVHGDRPDAARFARTLRAALEQAGVEITHGDSR